MLKIEALKKIRRYCAYQDRCHAEVRSKLLSMGVFGSDLEDIIADLISEDFLNEERFAKSFARGKFRIKKWGKTRIKNELTRREISVYCIRKAMEEIEPDIYLEVLNELIKAQNKRLIDLDVPARIKKLTGFGLKKGYEMDLVIEAVRAVVF